MVGYIRSSRNLFWVAILVFVGIICVSMMIVSSSNANFYFGRLKNDSVLSNGLANSEYDFWKYFMKGGESMGTYAKISKASGKSETIIKIIKSFFEIDGVDETGTTSSLTKNFKWFNIWIQISMASMGILLFSLLSLTMALGSIIWRYALIGKPFNFYKLSSVLLFNLFGLLFFYFLEKEMDEEKRRDLMGDNELFLENKRKLMKLKTIENDLNRENILVIKNLFFSHEHRKDNREYILKDINLTIKRGSFNIIIGPNGSGKTTLIKTLINLYENIEGEILWNGKNMSEIDRTSFAQYVSYIPQILNLDHHIAIPDFLKFSRYPYRNPMEDKDEMEEEIIMESIRLGGCEELAHKTMNELSGGEKQRILLAGILAQKTTEVIVLDEPTSFLDIKNQHIFLERLKEFNRNGKTIIMILHDLQQAMNYANNLIVMKDNRVKKVGHPTEIISRELIRDVFSIDCEIMNVNGNMEISNIYAAEG